jgi:hypothetical protein
MNSMDSNPTKRKNWKKARRSSESEAHRGSVPKPQIKLRLENQDHGLSNAMNFDA